MSFVFEVVDTVVSPILDVVSDVGDVVMDSPVFDVMDFVRDEIAAPVFDVAIDNIDIYDAINIGITVASGGTIPPWVIGVSSGAATIARGGDLSDAIKAGAISYAGSTIGKTFDAKIAPRITDTLTAEGFNQTVSNLINEGVKSSAKALVYGQDPLKAFAIGGINAGVGAALGVIDDAYTNLTGEYELTDLGEFKLDADGLKIPVVAGWENLQDGVKDAIAAGVTAELNGGDISSAVLTNIVSKYSGLAKTMNNYMTSEEGLGLDEDRARLLTTALGNAAGAAIDGNTELTFDAFFKTIENYGYKGLKEVIDKPVYEGLDKITGDYEKTAVAANTLNTTLITAQNVTDEYNSLRTTLQNEVDNAQAFYGTDLEAYDAAYAALQERYDTYYTPTFDALQSEYDDVMLAVNDAQIEYDDQSQYLMSDINDLNISLSPIFNEVQREIVLALKPDANLKVIANYLGVDEVDAASAFLSTSGSLTNMPNTQSEADAALDQTRLQYVTAALNARGIPIESLSPNQLGKYLNYAKEFLGNTNDILSLDMNEFADSMIYSAELSPEIVKAAKDAGFVPEESLSTLGVSGTTRGYEQFLEGTYIRFEKEGSPPEFLDTRGGWTPDSIIQRLEREGYTENDITHVGDGAYEKFKDDFNDHRWLGKTSLEDLSDAVSNFRYLEDPMQTTGTRVLDEVVLGEGVGAQQLLDGSAILTNNDGVPTWELRTTQDTATGGVDTSVMLETTTGVAPTATTFVNQYGVGNIDTFLYMTDVMEEGEDGVRRFTAIPGGATSLSEDRTRALDANGNTIGIIEPSPMMLATLVNLNPNDGQTFDDLVGTPIAKAAKTFYNRIRDDFSTEENKETWDNISNIFLLATGEMVDAVAGLDVLKADAPDAEISRYADFILSSAYDIQSDAWKENGPLIEELRTAPLNAWYEANPGKELSATDNTLLQLEGVYNAYERFPTQVLAQTIGKEVLQEIPLLLTGATVARIGYKSTANIAGKEWAAKFSSKLGITTAGGLNVAEAYGATASNTYDTIYATALRKEGVTEETATDAQKDAAHNLAVPAAQNAAAAAAVVTGALYVTGMGSSLEKTFLGAGKSTITTNAVKQLSSNILNIADIMVKEGISESIEEIIPQMLTDKYALEIDPNAVRGFDNVVNAGIQAFLTGGGTSGTLSIPSVTIDQAKSILAAGDMLGTLVGDSATSTGNVIADLLPRINPNINNIFANTSTAEEATAALQELGLTDNVILNNVLNSTYDTMYVSTNEANTAFSTVNPDYKPTQADIDSIVTSNPSADLDTAVAEFINPKFLSADEVKAAALEEGIILTDEQAEAYVGQKDEASATTDIRNEYDPLATTKDEATQYFADTGYTATPEELADFIGTLNEEVQKTAIGDYVNPRQVTKDEAKQFLEDVGYNADEDEIARFIGQTNDDTFQDTQRTAINEYTDPRVVTGDEVRSRFQELGLNDPTETDVGKFTGQFDQTAKLNEIEEYLPTAQYNSIAELLGKPARDVTQVDVDFVVDLLAQEDVITEQQTTQYDVTGDNVVDQLDVDLLQQTLGGNTDTALADTSMFNPATGLYADLDTQNDTQSELDTVIDLNTQLNTQINTQNQQNNMRDFLQMGQMGMFDGAKTTVTNPDPFQLDYTYDIGGTSIFANPQQEALFATPYGDPRGTTRNFAQGGQVIDRNDMLLKLLGEM